MDCGSMIRQSLQDDLDSQYASSGVHKQRGSVDATLSSPCKRHRQYSGIHTTSKPSAWTCPEPRTTDGSRRTKRQKTQSSEATLSGVSSLGFDMVAIGKELVEDQTTETQGAMVRDMIVRRLENTAWVFLGHWPRNVVRHSVENRLCHLM